MEATESFQLRERNDQTINDESDLPPNVSATLPQSSRTLCLRNEKYDYPEDARENIKACLIKYQSVRDAAVVLFSGKYGQRLIAYIVTEEKDDLIRNLRKHLSVKLPGCMIPDAYVKVSRIPITLEGKLDIGKLPEPDENDVVRDEYEEPLTNIERRLASSWSDVLGIERISRHDSFFELGGNSLHAIRLIERLKIDGLTMTVRDLFETPVLSDAASILRQHVQVRVPPNLIMPNIEQLTPNMLPLIDLTQEDINRIVTHIPGGLNNVQDIYALSPLQDGILYHHMLVNKGDPYLILTLSSFQDRFILERYLRAVQVVIDRHDILRTAFVWEELSTPAQVVLRRAHIHVTEYSLLSDEHCSVADQLKRRYDPHWYRIDLRQAPLLHFHFAQESDGRWILVELQHHLIGDHQSSNFVSAEIASLLGAKETDLSEPIPFRNLIATVRLGITEEDHDRFFTEMLGDITEPSFPFDLSDIHRDNSKLSESNISLSHQLTSRLREQARVMRTSLATLYHLAWAQVISRTSNNETTVFGTVLFGRMSGRDSFATAMGLFINTLPIRVDVDATPVYDCVRRTHRRLADLFEHEHTSLALAQRCSGIRNGIPLFNSLLNCRHQNISAVSENIAEGIENLESIDRTHYPLNLSIDDYGHSIRLAMQAAYPVDTSRLCGYMDQALESIANALEATPHIPARSLRIVPESEWSLLLGTCHDSMSLNIEQPCIHQLFERRVSRTPEATAIIFRDCLLTYAQLNTRANVLALVLIQLSVMPDQLVAICVDRSPAMIICILAILKAGGAYLPLDIRHSSQRLSDILNDGNPKIVLADDVGYSALKYTNYSEFTYVNPNTLTIQSCMNPKVASLSSANLAYAIYTSGSTGKPKGVLIEHRNIVRMLDSSESIFHFDHTDVWALWYSFTSDVSVWVIWGALCYGGQLVLIPYEIACSSEEMYRCVCSRRITVLDQTPTAFNECISNYIKNPEQDDLRLVFLGGERLDPVILSPWFASGRHSQCRLINAYGPTEATIQATYKILNRVDSEQTLSPIGRKFTHAKVYVLNTRHEPVPFGVTGELYIGGGCVARSYLNRPDLTAISFFRDPFSVSLNGRMYKTGDLVRYLPDGSLEFIGRIDRQLKIRGFRVEPDEIEACLVEYHSVHAAAVVLFGRNEEQRLIAYIVAEEEEDLIRNLRDHVVIKLPGYMVPNAYVRVAKIPLTSNGKLDVEKLPRPNENDVVRNEYVEPSGVIEQSLARSWSDVLGIGNISRNDSFFAIGGHSLHAMRVIERLRLDGLTMTVRDLFENPVLADVANILRHHVRVQVPPNLITPNIKKLTPSMLPLIDLTQSEIDRIVSTIPGGLDNIQDVYALSPLQDGILFHYSHVREGDPYLLMTQLSFKDRSFLERYLSAVQKVVDRHDILRTAFVWEELSTAAQVVLRRARVHISEHSFVGDKNHSVADQLKRCYDPVRYRIDIREAPLMHFHVAQESNGRWILHELQHHLIGDHETVDLISGEIASFLDNDEPDLPKSIPFRNLIARAKREANENIYAQFFTAMLIDITEPSLLFGFRDVHQDGFEVKESYSSLSSQLINRLREHAKLIETSLAVLCHTAWAQVVSRTSNNEKAVFGTVLFGRMGANDDFSGAIGLYMNTLPIRIDINDTTIIACVRQTHTRLASLFNHEHASLALAQRCSGIETGIPLFNSLLNFRHSNLPVNSKIMTESVDVLESVERTNYPLDLSVDYFGDGMGLAMQAVHPLDPSRLCAYMEQALKSTVRALEVYPQMSTRLLRILPKEERLLLVETLNEPVTSSVDESCIHQLFEQRVLIMPENIALVFERENLTYAELNSRANVLAHLLVKLGVMPDQLVAICVDRSFVMIICILAILKAGGAYLPLDPHHSSQRLIDIIYDANPNVILADGIGRETLNSADCSKFTVVDPTMFTIQQCLNPKVNELSAANLAYVIYTSGSTGKPKGVLIEHKNIVQMFDGVESLFRLSHEDVWCLWYSITSDVSVWLIWGALCYGGKLVLIPFDVSYSPTATYRTICSNKVTVLTQTPTAFKQSISNYVENPKRDHLRLILLGGERLHYQMFRRWFDVRGNSECQVVNVYGPTEATVQASYRLLNQEDAKQTYSPIGWRFTHLKLYVLDSHGVPVPFGVAGELYIGGDCVARGYLNRPDLSAMCFLPDPFSSSLQGRMYKTGDFVRYLPDGSLDFIGRNDRQLKVRGFRIEPGDIEACLIEYHLVRAAAVVLFGEDQEYRLIAYVVAEAEDNLIRNLRRHVAVRLPGYMVPNAYVRVSEIPITHNGKLDVKKLPKPDENDVVRDDYEEPLTNIERRLASSWSDVLGIERISRHDSFFELGGHSLHAIRLIERLKIDGLTMTVRDLFETPVLSDAANILRQHVQVRVPPNLIMPNIEQLTPNMLPLIDLTQEDINRIVTHIPGGLNNVQDIYALSPLQDGILYHHMLVNEGDPYLILTLSSFQDRFILERYLRAVQVVIDRHDILRTAFVWEELSTPAQVVLRRAHIHVTEYSLLSDEHCSVADQLKRRYDPHWYRIDLRQAPLLHFHFAQESDGRWILVELQHHLIGDHQSSNFVSAEIASLLGAKETDLSEPIPFRNLIATVRLGITEEDHDRFFTEMLGDITEPSFPFDLSDIHRDNSKLSESNISLSHQLTSRLREQARVMRTSLATLYHLAWAQVISRTSNNETTVFGTVLFGRMSGRDSFATAMGLFINTLPIRVDVDATPVYDCVRRTHRRLADLFEHEHTSLALAQRCSGIRNGIPLFNSLLNCRHQNISAVSENIAEGIENLESIDRTHYPLNLSIDDYGHSIRLAMQAAYPVDTSRLCGYMDQALESIANALEATPHIPARSLRIVPESEWSLLLGTCHDSMSLNIEQPCIHQLFERRVSRTPEATAIIFRDCLLTYAQLNTRANVLALVLIQLSVMPDQLVAICVDRSPAMIICILAILKAGGAYLPLDIRHSSQRLSDILNDGNPKIVLADDVGYSALKYTNYSEFTYVNPNTLTIQSCMNPKVASLSSANLAYAIYTSGSTGKPKGVLIEHRNIVRMLDSSESIFHFDHTDVWALWYSFTSDVSVWVIWGALCYGGQLVLIPYEIACSSEEMYRCVCSRRITVLDQTPTAFNECISNYIKNPEQDDLRLVFLGGERLDPVILSPWFASGRHSQCRLINAYGPTEATIQATYKILNRVDSEQTLSPIGRKFTHAKVYVLNTRHEPVPFGVTGELYIGGGCVARSYLNRPDLTAISFFRDPFSVSLNGRMYKTGDLVRYLPDGSLEFIGRIDRQLKIRGFRVEPDEIEACLVEYHSVHAAAVVLFGRNEEQRLIAYIVAEEEEDLIRNLRDHVVIKLPGYMVPNAYVRVAKIPLTSNGKLDVEKLPRPNENDVVRNEYVEPSGVIEQSLARSWSDVLGIGNISRNDSFFAIGGHSLHAMRVIERLRLDGLTMTVRDLFENPVLADVANILRHHVRVQVPPNLITPNIKKLTPSMLPLIDLTQSEIDRIVSTIPGGLDNIQDVYALSPLQDGILFHYSHVREGDPYLLMTQLSFKDRSFLERYLSAVQKVVDRHDILRTAFVWEELSTAAQVVLRRARVHISEHSFVGDKNHSVADQLKRCYDPVRYRIDIREAPLMHFHVAQESNGRWILHELQHHLIGDHETVDLISGEIASFLDNDEPDLPKSIPFRNLIARAKREANENIYAQFFTAMLIDITEPSLLFGFRDVHQDGFEVKESYSSLSSQLINRLREHAKLIETSLAVLCHTAWAQVVSRTSNNEKAVFGTVLFGRMGANDDFSGAIGLYMNTLPIRIDINDTTIIACVRQTHTRLASLFNHEHASLALAQRCSGIETGIPLFNSLLNFRHSNLPVNSKIMTESVDVLESVERTNYPLDLSVDYFGDGMGLAMQAVHPLDPSRLCAYMEQALKSTVRALEVYPQMSTRLLRILPKEERLLLVETLNEPVTSSVDESCIHQLFEQRVLIMPENIALVFERENLTYAELNSRANVLAHLLVKLGVMPDQLVAICVDRSFVMIICILAILKAGGAYLPLDPHHSSQRLIDIIYDANPNVILADGIGRETLNSADCSKFTVVDPTMFTIQQCLNPKVNELSAANLAYVIYTSGSTGKPKGVLIEHKNIVQMFDGVESLFRLSHEDVWCLWYSITSDVSVWLIWGALCYGGKLVLIPFDVSYSPTATYRTICSNKVTVLTQTPTAFKQSISNYVENPKRDHLRLILLGGERLHYQMFRRWFDVRGNSECQVVNVYGPTEATVQASYRLLNQEDAKQTYSPIGWRFTHLKLYVLDSHGVPVPFGVAGELYIGGDCVARGYLNRPDLSAMCFLPDPFSSSLQGRMYKTGDFVRYLPDGSLDFIGRNDRQLKVRGFRIEPGEIEACLTEYHSVRAAAVVSFREGQEQLLVAYIVAEAENNLVRNLRQHVALQMPAYMVPDAYVRVSKIPLTHNGKLEYKKLPEPHETDVVRNEYEEPLGEIERILALSWSDVFGMKRISRHDSFFHLGGHSMVAFRLMNISASRGLIFTLNDLFHHPIFADLASHIRLESRLDWPRDIICIRSEGTEAPIFFVPSGAGDISYVFALAHDISSIFPIYVLSWPSFKENTSVSSMEGLAFRMIRTIRSIQTEGPYNLCGYSSGGLLAYSIAELLFAMGHRIGFLGFIDTYFPDTQSQKKVINRHSSTADLADECRHEQFSNATYVASETEVCLDASILQIEQWNRYAGFICDFLPQDLGLTIHQYRATEPDNGSKNTDMTISAAVNDSSSGWAKHLPKSRFHVIPIPGNHISMMNHLDNRLILCDAINSVLLQL